MRQTEHYQLNQWDFEDQILMADFNNDNKKLTRPCTRWRGR